MMQHDEELFRFDSNHSTPMRKHVGYREFEIHWARTMPYDRNGIIEMHLHDPRACKYLEMDRKLTNGYDPERTTLLENVCFCLVDAVRR